MGKEAMKDHPIKTVLEDLLRVRKITKSSFLVYRIHRIRVNNQGYTKAGQYFGVGDPIWCFYLGDGATEAEVSSHIFRQPTNWNEIRKNTREILDMLQLNARFTR